MRLYDTKAWRRARKRLRGLPCVACGQPSDTVDHIVAIAEGGTNEPSNLQPMCGRCNYVKGGQLGHRRRVMRRRATGRW